MKKIKFAVVGCGSIGKRHVAVLDAESNAEIVAICDIDGDKAKELSELYDGIPFWTNFVHMLNGIEADIVCIATPHAEHCDMTIDALDRGFNVLVEKPMAINTHQCDVMIQHAKDSNRKLWVVKQNRFNIPIQLTKNAIKDGRLGKIFMVKCDVLWNRYQGYYDDSSWRGRLPTEGGALFTQVSHFIDLLIWWCGDVEKTTGVMATQNHDIETEDCGSAILKFKEGTIGSINWTTNVYSKNYEGSITIIGEKGTIKIGGKYLNQIDYWDVEGFPLDENIDFSDKPNAYGKYQGTSSNHDKVIERLIHDFNGNVQSDEMVDGFEGKKSIEVIQQIYKSIWDIE